MSPSDKLWQSSETDCFSLLPLEIRLQIATTLDTVDFFNLRLASRSMSLIFEIQSFWKSRFQIDKDRGFIAYLIQNLHESCDWRVLYHNTAKLDFSDITKLYTDYHKYHLYHQYHMHRMYHNRAVQEDIPAKSQLLPWMYVIWEHQIWIRERYSMTRANDEQVASSKSLFTGSRWKGVYTGVNCHSSPYRAQKRSSCKRCTGSNTPFVQAVPIEDSLSALAVSVLREGCDVAISGFELIYQNPEKPNLILGYRIPGRQVFIDLRGPGRKLKGFSLITSSGRIHAIRPIFTDNRITSDWIGQEEPIHISERSLYLGSIMDTSHDGFSRAYEKRYCRNISVKKSIKALRARFDVRIFLFRFNADTIR